MEALLRKSCPSCTESSIKTYTVNVRALAKEAGLETPPAHAKWLTQKLLNKIKAKPVNQYKRLAIAGVKALGAYEKKRCYERRDGKIRPGKGHAEAHEA